MPRTPKAHLCKDCGETDPEQFVWVNDKRKSKPYQNRSTCRSCLNKRRNRWPTSHEKKKGQHLNAKYGITLKDYYRLLNEQGGRCLGCGNFEADRKEGSRKWPVDHDHETGAVRGILCPGCNQALGLVKDSRETLKNLRRYLKEASRES